MPKGSTSGQHKGLYYSAVSSQKEKTLISFIDDIVEYLNKEVKTSERAVEGPDGCRRGRRPSC